MECVSDDASTTPAFAWKTFRELAEQAFARSEDFKAVSEAFKRAHRAHANGGEPLPALGWFDEVSDWVDGIGKEYRRTLSGRFQQWNAAPGFSLIRFETHSSALWFKAVGEPRQHEFQVTRKLCELFPSDLPRALAFRREWNAWVTENADGCCLDEICCPEAWQYVAGRLAQLQTRSIDHAQAIREAGAADLRNADSERIAELFAYAKGAMAQQKKRDPAPMTCCQLDEVRRDLEQALAEIAQVGTPQCLGHLDFNPGNVVVARQGSCTFLDWAEAYVGYPFATFEYLLQHFRRTALVDLRWEQRLREAYWGRWAKVLSDDQVQCVQRFTPLLAVFLYAANLLAQYRSSEESRIAGYMRSLFRRMRREAALVGESGVSTPLPA